MRLMMAKQSVTPYQDDHYPSDWRRTCYRIFW